MTTPSVQALLNQFEQFSRVMRPPYADILVQLTKSIEPFRLNHLAILEQLKPLGAIAQLQLQPVVQANSMLYSSLAGIGMQASGIDDLSKAHLSWIRTLKETHEPFVHLQASAIMALSASARITTISEPIFARINFDVIQHARGFQESIITPLRNQLVEMTKCFETLVRSVESLPALTALPSLVMPSASREVLLTGLLAATLSPQSVEGNGIAEDEILSEIREETSSLTERLTRIDPALARAYSGARQVLAAGNADRGRHVLTSLREMWGHLLRRIAPDEKVLTWAEGKSTDLHHLGKPTRQARVLYLCREINHGAFTEFVDADTKSLVAHVNFLNRVHQLEPGLTDTQLSVLLLRTDSWLTFIICISEACGDTNRAPTS